MNRNQFLAGGTAIAAASLFLRLPADAQHLAGPDGLLADLALADRILAREGIVDGLGHASVRDPQDHTRYYLSRSMAPALVTAGDVIAYDLDSKPLEGDTRQGYIERYIHGEIYKARPDVMAVVHAHTPSVIPFGDTGVALRPMYHMAAFLQRGVPIFDIDGVGGDGTDMLVSNPAFGAALAKTLGQADVALMRGHGMVTVGTTIREAVYRAYYTAQNAQLQAEALKLGPVRYLSANEAAAAEKAETKFLARCWQVWSGDLHTNA
ncbi:MAG TPA: class II aldolase/adducin family protein [Candidatus Limnocylindria bacterium]|jgi:HCOMODA/2-hydroxy-3-carboxy-muconic semialdehyde decarboxylase|nr:class II aldolase/adducin family protein [Candidatus Limnocylindria bacterium]